MIEFAGLFASALMLFATAWLVARHTFREPGERFWIFLAAIVAQLGAASLLLSWYQAYAPGPFLLVQAGFLAIVATPCLLLAHRKRSAAMARGVETPPRNPVPLLLRRPDAFKKLTRDPVSLALLIVIGAVLALSGAEQWVTPLHGHDERMYHGPRAIFWVQYRSIFPFETHNDRHTVFPFAVELSFAWSLLFVKDELPARMAFWLALPATAIGMFLLARQIRVPQRFALAAALLYITTPTVLRHASSLKSDAWQPLMVMGVAYFAIRAFGSPAAVPRRWLGSGLFFACALSVKTTSLALAPGLAVLALSRLRFRHSTIAVAGLTLGALGGIALTGFASLAYWNMRDHGHPLGPPDLSKVVQPEMTFTQMRTHAARLPLHLLEFPDLTEQPRKWLLKRKEDIAAAAGADTPLIQESDRGWPGLFWVTLWPQARSYSLGGLLWLPILLFGTIRVLREVFRRWRPWIRGRRSMFNPVASLVILQMPLFLGVVFAVRWMLGGPDRFWLGAYGMVVPVIAYFFALWSRRSSLAGAVGILLLVWAVYPSLRERIITIERVTSTPINLERLDAPYQLVVPHLGPDDVVLLFAGQGSRDYALFGPRRGYSTRIIPWGKGEFDEARFRDLLEQKPITHVFFERDQVVGFHWAGRLLTAPFVQWLEESPEFEHVPLSDDGQPQHMRLFRRTP